MQYSVTSNSRAKQNYFVIINQQEVEKILEKEVVENLKSKRYEVIPPVEYNASKTIIVKRLGSIIDEYTSKLAQGGGIVQI